MATGARQVAADCTGRGSRRGPGPAGSTACTGDSGAAGREGPGRAGTGGPGSRAEGAQLRRRVI